jgi:hypothetical protein
MALTLSIRDNRAGHCSFRPSSLLLVLLEGAGQRAGGVDLAARKCREGDVQGLRHMATMGSMGGAWQRPEFALQNGLELD